MLPERAGIQAARRCNLKVLSVRYKAAVVQIQTSTTGAGNHIVSRQASVCQRRRLKLIFTDVCATLFAVLDVVPA
jgi:hypothetical protein